MKNQFCTYEIAKALKELGFDEPCMAVYYGNENLVFTAYNHPTNEDRIDNHVTAPLYQQVIDWLREKHGIFIGPDTYGDDNYAYKIWLRGANPDKPNRYAHYTMTNYFDTYQEAREAAIIKALELIKAKI